MNKKMTYSFMAGLVVSAVALYFALRRVPFGELLDYLKEINYGWVLLSGGITLPCFALRACRWRIILESHRKLGFWQAFHPLMIGFMLNCILPGRLGEAARPFVLTKKENFPFTTGLATVAVERLMDLAFLIILSTMVLYTVEIAPDFSISFGSYQLSSALLETAGKSLLRLCLILMAGILLLTVSFTRTLMRNLLLASPGIIFFTGPAFKNRIREKLIHPVLNLIELFATGFSLLKSPMKIAECLALTGLIWGGTALSYYVMAKGCPGINLSFPESIALMVIICLFIALPSVPGFWGIWEAGGVFALSLFGVSVKTAAGFTLTNHAIQIFPVIIIGLISAMIASVDILQLSKIPPENANRQPGKVMPLGIDKT
ncbi:MAG: lysylphosphatidylglycerol synthase transmembrane domain-containing protein [Pseudomonadota bacterium]